MCICCRRQQSLIKAEHLDEPTSSSAAAAAVIGRERLQHLSGEANGRQMNEMSWSRDLLVRARPAHRLNVTNRFQSQFALSTKSWLQNPFLVETNNCRFLSNQPTTVGLRAKRRGNATQRGGNSQRLVTRVLFGSEQTADSILVVVVFASYYNK